MKYKRKVYTRRQEQAPCVKGEETLASYRSRNISMAKERMDQQQQALLCRDKGQVPHRKSVISSLCVGGGTAWRLCVCVREKGKEEEEEEEEKDGWDRVVEEIGGGLVEPSMKARTNVLI